MHFCGMDTLLRDTTLLNMCVFFFFFFFFCFFFFAVKGVYSRTKTFAQLGSKLFSF